MTIRRASSFVHLVGAVVCSLLLIGAPVMAQSPSQGKDQSETSTSDDYLKGDIDLETGEDTGALTNYAEQTSEQNVSSGESSISWYLARTVVVLVILSVIIWGIVKFLKKSGFAGASNQFMSVHSTLAVGQNQYLQIVQVGKQFFMIGVTNDNVNMLGEITDSETITDLQLNGGEDEDREPGTGDFGELLSQFTGTSAGGASDNDQSTTETESQLSDLKDKIQDMRASGGTA